MKNKTKIWLIIATALILVGCIIFGVVMAVLKWDFSKLGTVKYETDSYAITEEFKNISIVTDTADIRFILSDDGESRVVCFEEKNIKHSVVVENETLKIGKVDTRKWYQNIGIATGSTRITVYLSKTEYGSLVIKTSTGDIEIPENFKFESINISESTGDVTNKASASGEVKIKASTGDINIDNISAQKLDLKVSTGHIAVNSVKCDGDFETRVGTGKIKLSEITCKNFFSNGDTGMISLKNVVAAESFSIKRDTGDVKFERCDASEIFVETTTGDIKGSLRTEKVFITKTDTGDVDVPKTATGGKCELHTGTGDIEISVQ